MQAPHIHHKYDQDDARDFATSWGGAFTLVFLELGESHDDVTFCKTFPNLPGYVYDKWVIKNQTIFEKN